MLFLPGPAWLLLSKIARRLIYSLYTHKREGDILHFLPEFIPRIRGKVTRGHLSLFFFEKCFGSIFSYFYYYVRLDKGGTKST